MSNPAIIETGMEAAWMLQEFACSDCGAQLQGDKYDSIDHGLVDGLRDVALLCPACANKRACPYCGEIGGEPVTTYSREWQGCAEHGGMVTWQDERCTLCARGSR